MKGKKDEGSPGCVGHVIVYVDDIMALSTPEIRERVFPKGQTGVEMFRC